MAQKFKFSTTTTTAVSLAASLATGANTYSGLANCTMNAVDNSTDKYPHAKFVLEIPDTFGAAPTAGSVFNVYLTENNIDGTADETPLPAATDIVNLARWVCAVRMDNQDVAVRKPEIVHNCLAGVTEALFYLENQTGQTASYTSNPITLKVTPFTYEDV